MAKNKEKNTVKLDEKSNAGNAPGRATFPRGTEIRVNENKEILQGAVAGSQVGGISNPATAAAGALSGGNGNAPGRIPERGNPFAFGLGTQIQNNPASGAWANYNAQGSGVKALRSPTPIVDKFVNNPASGAWANYNQQQAAQTFNPRVGQTGNITGVNNFLNYASNVGSWLIGNGSWANPTPFPNYPSTFTPSLQPTFTPGQSQQALQTHRAGETGRTPTPLKPGQWQGTAGMYTYGQFSNPGEAFATLLDRGVPTNIPAYLADRYGLSGALQQPDSGWVMQGGNWVNTNPGTGNSGTGGGSGGGGGGGVGGDNPPKWVRNWRGQVVRNKYNLSNYRYGDLGDGEMKGENSGRDNDGGGYRYGGRDVFANPYNRDLYSEPAPFTGSWGVVNFNTGGG